MLGKRPVLEPRPKPFVLQACPRPPPPPRTPPPLCSTTVFSAIRLFTSKEESMSSGVECLFIFPLDFFNRYSVICFMHTIYSSFSATSKLVFALTVTTAGLYWCICQLIKSQRKPLENILLVLKLTVDVPPMSSVPQQLFSLKS